MRFSIREFLIAGVLATSILSLGACSNHPSAVQSRNSTSAGIDTTNPFIDTKGKITTHNGMRSLVLNENGFYPDLSQEKVDSLFGTGSQWYCYTDHTWDTQDAAGPSHCWRTRETCQAHLDKNPPKYYSVYSMSHSGDGDPHFCYARQTAFCMNIRNQSNVEKMDPVCFGDSQSCLQFYDRMTSVKPETTSKNCIEVR